MPGVTVENFGADFTKYLPGVRKTLNEEMNARKMTTGKLKWQGTNLEFRVHVSRNPAVGNIEDGGNFPVAGKQGYVPAKAYRKFMVGSVQLTDGALANAATTENAAISVTESELTGLIMGLKKYANGMWTRDGTGIVATLGATVSGSTVSVSDARMLWDGKDFEIRDAATPTTIHTNFTVSRTARAFNASNEAVVTTAASVSSVGQAQGDYVVWGTGANSSYGRAITGLDALIDDAATTFQNVNCATYPRYTSPVLSNSGTARALTPSLFRQMLSMLRQETGESPGGITVLTNIFEAINVEELYEGELRITPDTTVAGVAVASFQSTLGRINIATDPDFPYGKMMFLAPEEITYAVQAELDWRRDAAGQPVLKRSDTFAGFTGTAIEIGELVIEQRNKCGKIEDLAETKSTAY
jgi:hypothetical protein